MLSRIKLFIQLLRAQLDLHRAQRCTRIIRKHYSLPKKTMITPAIYNHERWHVCSSCGHEFDAKDWPECPKCNQKPVYLLNQSLRQVTELTELNSNSQYDQLIANAKSGRYHDYKNPEDVVCGKVELVQDLTPFPELHHLRKAVMNGEYDEQMDDEDKAIMRAETPEGMWKMLSL